MEPLNENPNENASSTVPDAINNEKVSATGKKKKPKNPRSKSSDVEISISDDEKSGGTQGTVGTTSNDAASTGSPTENDGGTQGTFQDDFDLTKAVNPLHDAVKSELEKVSFAKLNLPCFIVKNDWFLLDGHKHKSGVWFFYQTEATEKKPAANVALRVCSPLYVDKMTNTEDGKFFGRLLRFRDSLGRWRTWAMPMELLRGSCEEIRGELLAAGVEIEQRNRIRLADYLQWETPKETIIAATRTGWTKKGNAFVFYDYVVGDKNVHFQSEAINSDGAAKTGGDYTQWQAMAKLCEGNFVLMLSICVSLSGALLLKVIRDSGGVHWTGDSSIGKTTALCVGASVWGGEDFKRTWRATSNGLEGVAALLSDTCLCLDEISEADPREIGAIVYSLGNGMGKTRANRIGSARQTHRWRLSLLSTGERSISAAMLEGGKQIKAGQLVRLLNIPAKRKFGVFDELHHFPDGRTMADFFKTECANHYGHAGVKFVEYLLCQNAADFGKTLAEIESQFEHKDSQSARAAIRFAIYAMAGELAIEAGILQWQQGTALNASKLMFSEWLEMQGTGATEHKQILQNVHDFILKFGDKKFTAKNNQHEKPHLERAGWYDQIEGKGFIYMFTNAALREAGGNYDFKRVLDALDSEGWIVERDFPKRSKKTHIAGDRKHSLYWIFPIDNEQ